MTISKEEKEAIIREEMSKRGKRGGLHRFKSVSSEEMRAHMLYMSDLSKRKRKEERERGTMVKRS